MAIATTLWHYTIMKKTTLRLDQDVYDAIQDQCERFGDFQHYVNKALRAQFCKKQKKAVAKSGGFVKPAVDEIRAYCADNKYDIDAQGFVDFYDSKGWKVGSQAMKDWKACIRTWVKRKQEKVANSGSLIERTERKAQTAIADADIFENALARNGQNLFLSMD